MTNHLADAIATAAAMTDADPFHAANHIIRAMRQDAVLANKPYADLPKPRLQLRWEPTGAGPGHWRCWYELVLPAKKYDIRDDDGLGYIIIPMTSTDVTGGTPFEDGEIRTPWRDGVHAGLDSAALGGLPAYAVHDGKARLISPAA